MGRIGIRADALRDPGWKCLDEMRTRRHLGSSSRESRLKRDGGVQVAGARILDLEANVPLTDIVAEPALRGRTLALLAATVTSVCVASVAGGPGRAESATSVTAPRTLVALTVPISNFAQDGGRMAWMTGRCRDYARPVDDVALRAISGGPRRVLAKVCGLNDPQALAGDAGLALAGTRVLFWWPVEGGNLTYHRIATAAVEDRQVRMLGVFGILGDEYLAAAGGEGGTLVHAVAGGDVENDCLGEPIPCVYTSSGRVLRVAPRSLIPIPGVPVPAALDASGAEVAVAPAARRWREQKRTLVAEPSAVPAAVNGAVQIRNARTGALRATFAPRGRVLDLALAGDAAAVLVDRGSTLRIERYAAEAGRLLGTARVPDTAQDIDVAGSNVVYRVANDVHLFAAGRTTLVARASSSPIGLSIVGRRIAWAENVGGRGRIKSVTLLK